MTRPFAIALGGNLGDRYSHLRSAAVALVADARIRLPRLSGIYESPPAEGVRGGSFLNSALSGLWTSDAHALLDLCRSVEKAAGSPVIKGGGARTLDLDLLFVGDEILLDGELILPHPGIRRRSFVLVPLSDLLGDRPIPSLGASPAELLARLPCSGDIAMFEKPPSPGEIWSRA